jgi:hypothetical protein
MPGGLIQIVTYGSQDLFLTGTPEITFFKVVYRRHTNFSMESIRVDFNDPVGFGRTSTITIPKIGDLMHKTYLEIILPQIDLKRSDASNNNFLDFIKARNDYEIVQSFMGINRRAYSGSADIYVAENITDTLRMETSINSVFNDVTNQEPIDNFRNLLITTELNIPYRYEEISMQSIANSVPNDVEKDVLFDALNIGLSKSIKTQKIFYDEFNKKREENLDEKNENIKFAWVDKVGHALIDLIEVNIGGQKIDKHYGHWINIWYELTANRDMEKIYNKMVGNVDILTKFDRNVKPKYILRIPLQFWFCRNNGLALPLVSMEYHDVTLDVKFRNIEDVCYIENGKTIYISDKLTNIFLDEVPNELELNIESALLIDYIYLDKNERRRFAQSSHEYLIDQLQDLEIKNINQRILQCELNNFVHPSKEIIWTAQQVKYLKNTDGYTKLRWDNYSLTDENKGNPILYSTIGFHSYDRVSRLEGNYFNYVQPYETHSTTPSDGINMYSFSIFPEEHQPSGSANLGRLSRIVLTLEFDPSLFPEETAENILNDENKIVLRIYTRSLNILRFISGMGGIVYAFG